VKTILALITLSVLLGQVSLSQNWLSDVETGQQAARNLKVSLLDDPDVAEYVNRIGQNLVRHSDAKAPFTIRVIDSDEINALPLPGGFLYVTTELILTANNEDELAGLMAHQIAHINARHWTRQGEPTSFYTRFPVETLQKAAGLNVPLTFLCFRPQEERTTDLLALQYMNAANYAPDSIVTFSDRMLSPASTSTNVSVLFTTHLQTPQRIRQTRQDIAALPIRQQPSQPTPDFLVIKRRITDLTDRGPL